MFRNRNYIIKKLNQEKLLIPSLHAWLDALTKTIYFVYNHIRFEDKTGLKTDDMLKEGFVRIFKTQYDTKQMAKLVVDYDEKYREECRNSLRKLFEDGGEFVDDVDKIIFTSDKTYKTVEVGNFLKFGFKDSNEQNYSEMKFYTESAGKNINLKQLINKIIKNELKKQSTSCDVAFHAYLDIFDNKIYCLKDYHDNFEKQLKKRLNNLQLVIGGLNYRFPENILSFYTLTIDLAKNFGLVRIFKREGEYLWLHVYYDYNDNKSVNLLQKFIKDHHKFFNDISQIEFDNGKENLWLSVKYFLNFGIKKHSITQQFHESNKLEYNKKYILLEALLNKNLATKTAKFIGKAVKTGTKFATDPIEKPSEFMMKRAVDKKIESDIGEGKTLQDQLTSALEDDNVKKKVGDKIESEISNVDWTALFDKLLAPKK